jgi:hypothetical protein
MPFEENNKFDENEFRIFLSYDPFRNIIQKMIENQYETVQKQRVRTKKTINWR